MVVTIIGVEHRKGDFVDKKTNERVVFDNIQIYANGPIPSPTKEGFALGKAPITEKFQNDKDILESVFGSVPTADDLKSMVGVQYEFYYNQKRRLEMIKPFEAPLSKTLGNDKAL